MDVSANSDACGMFRRPSRTSPVESPDELGPDDLLMSPERESTPLTQHYLLSPRALERSGDVDSSSDDLSYLEDGHSTSYQEVNRGYGLTPPGVKRGRNDKTRRNRRRRCAKEDSEEGGCDEDTAGSDVSLLWESHILKLAAFCTVVAVVSGFYGLGALALEELSPKDEKDPTEVGDVVPREVRSSRRR